MLRHARYRRGSYIAEAAVVLPFVILSILTSVLIVLYFYDSSLTQCRMHRALRCEAGVLTGKVTTYSDDDSIICPEDLWDGSITSSGAVFSKRLTAESDVSLISQGLLSHSGSRQLSAELRAVDPAYMLRIRQIAAGKEEESDHEYP